MQGNKWDIFCRVVDNFGDIGVCWRLARQLATEHGLKVRLWTDDLANLGKLCPAIDPNLATQTQQGVPVQHWATPFTFNNDVADVVIEAFACELPDTYLAAMTKCTRPSPPVWINLEYLSAEDWIAGCHGLVSPHPRLPLHKYFFFPGFVPQSGGLLREARLMAQHHAWQADAAASRTYFGLPPAVSGSEEILVSLFCYDNPALPSLLKSWAGGSVLLRCLVPAGLALQQAAASLGQAALHPGEQLRQGNLILHALPFSSQEDYDRLLSLCAINFVRGEDSFVRAQWAAHPLVWQIYPQDADAHQIKLAAFLDLYCDGLSPSTASACRAFWQAWNSTSTSTAAVVWPAFCDTLPELSPHAAAWAGHLSEQPDLAGQLVGFCQNLL